MRRRLGSRLWCVLLLFTISLLLVGTAWPQTYKVLHNFCVDPNDGWGSVTGVTFGPDGNLYGTTAYGGADCQIELGYGIVFQLVPNADGTWSENILHTFSASDGGFPYSPVVFDGNRNLYGMTTEGVAHGTIFQLMPRSNGDWVLNTIHQFTGGLDGGFAPNFTYGGLVYAGGGRLYGTTEVGGLHNEGVVFSLSHVSPLFWYEFVVHAFGQAGIGGSEGDHPRSAPSLGPDGNLYGTTFFGGTHNSGTVYRLTPNRGGPGWTETVIYSFQGTSYGSGNDGANPRAGVVFDAAGNIYGTTLYGGPAAYGTVFKLTPNSDGAWTEGIIHAFQPGGNDGEGPAGPVAFDGMGNLYGTTISGGDADGYGTVYKLTPSSGGQWTETIVHLFNGMDGAAPTCGLVLDQSGNLYGTTTTGGAGGFEHGGVAFEITP